MPTGDRHTQAPEIISLSVGNWNDGGWLSNPGEPLASTEMRFFRPRITYNSLVSRDITFYVRIVNPNGQISRNIETSPDGFTFVWNGRINQGRNQSVTLTGWGNRERSTYQSGEHRVEVWYSNRLLISERVMIDPRPKITSLRAGNRAGGVWIDTPGTRLTSSRMRFLWPEITLYSHFSEEVQFYIRLLDPDGQIFRNQNISPADFTFSSTHNVNRGYQTIAMPGWGNADSSSYWAGIWTVEVWYGRDVRLISERVTIHP